MAKRFIDTSRYRQAWRKLDPKLRAAYAWLVENCDAAGFWEVDADLFRFECGYTLDVDKLMKETAGAVVRHSPTMLLISDFVEVNYGTLKEGYNPHKPALRALEAAKLEHKSSKLPPSLNQASSKLEDEDEDEDEVEGEGQNSEKKGTREAPEIWPSFADWWKLYAKGSRKLSSEQWAKLSKQDREAAFFATRAYIDSRPDPRYRKDGERFLRHRTWEDPIIDNSTPKTANNGPHITKPSSLSEADKINAALAILQRNDAHHG